MKHPPTKTIESKPEPIPEKKFLLTRILPTDRLSLNDQLAILRAFAAASIEKNSVPVTNSEVARFAEMQPTHVLLTTPFFCDLGLLTRIDPGFSVSPEAINYQTAYQAEEDNAVQRLKSIFEKSWFSQLITVALISGPITQYQAIKLLAESSAAPKEYESRLEFLLQFLEITGLILRRAGKIWLNDGSQKIPPIELPKQISTSEPISLDTIIPDELEKYELMLDTQKRRRVLLFAPASVSPAELARIQKWVAAQLLVIEPE